jgi:NAD(P)-dependent dehydrogenase (short-subunit alcohol dehydrogenase family)
MPPPTARPSSPLTGFTQTLGAEVRPHGVRACVVYPGAMATHWGA